MGLPCNPLPGQPPQLHGQVDSTSHLTRPENRRNITVLRYTLSAVLVDFSSEMCPEEEGGCSFTKQGLLQTALVVVYLMVSPWHVLSFIVMSHVTIIVMCVHIVIVRLLPCSATWVTATTASSC